MKINPLRYNFYVQTGAPRPRKAIHSGRSEIDDAVFESFDMHTEDACIVWNRVYIPLSYKYDISVILRDILNIIVTLTASTSGAFVNRFPSDTFQCMWSFKWTADDLRIEAVWNGLNGSLENFEALSTEISVSRSCFIGEWLELLRVVRDGVRYCGFDASVTEPLDSLLSECNGKYPRGLLYQDSPEDLQPS